MKIAFVGKGGSGKSTVSALFTRHLIDTNQRVLAVDADINQHFASLIGAPFQKELALSDDGNAAGIRQHLRGTNSRITSVESFVKTTPPGSGSRLVRIRVDDPIVAAYGTLFADHGYFMHVGTYGEDGIGTSCYHGNLAVFENVVSHTVLGRDEWLVADMVAGTDAFASALYLLFDVICIVVEPTPESLGVFVQFKALAKAAGVYERVFVVGNKIADDDDEAYIRQAVGDKLVCVLPHDMALRKARQQGETVGVSPALAEKLATLTAFVKARKADDAETLSRLHDLHIRYASQEYVVKSHGDIRGQIDGTFQYDASA